MKESFIHSLFATPIYESYFSKKFSNKELTFFNQQKNHCIKNKGNIYTIDNYILNRLELKNIKKYIQDCCDDYLKKIICPKDNIKIYITQSWLNYTEKNQFHHQHEHPNSIISGVFYINADKQNDTIRFSSNKYTQISPTIEKYNIWNSETWFFPVETGKLIMFPSSTTHQVDIKKGNNTRISLSFNTFYKGTIGEKKELSELII